MPIVIREHTLLKDFEKLLPKIYHKCCRPKLSDHEFVTLVIFPDTGVVQSRSLVHTLDKVLPSTEPIAVYANVFTQESFELMREKGVFFDSLCECDWTDASYINFKVRDRSRVKQPWVTKKDRSRNPH